MRPGGAAVLAWLIPALAWPGVAVASPCRPVATLEGTSASVDEVARLLRERGIALTVEPGCPVVRARMTRSAAGSIDVAIDDGQGRQVKRTVPDAASAATLIESWSRSDLSDAFLAGFGAPEPQLKVESPPAVERVGAESRPPRPVGVAAAAVTSLASDGSLWLGLDVSACVRLGWVCAGPTLRVAADTVATGASELHETKRAGVDVLVGVEVPLGWGSAQVTPGLGFGVGWMRASRQFDPARPGVHIEIDGGGLRTDGHVILNVPLHGALAFEASLGAGVSLMAHTSPIVDEGLTVAGEPRSFVRAGLGLRYGSP